MVRRRSLSLLGGVALAVGVAVVPIVAVAEPAQAASCSSSYWSGSGLFTATCIGPGQMKVDVYCDAVFPWPSWSDTSGWFNAPVAGESMAFYFEGCAGGRRWHISYR